MCPLCKSQIVVRPLRAQMIFYRKARQGLPDQEALAEKFGRKNPRCRTQHSAFSAKLLIMSDAKKNEGIPTLKIYKADQRHFP